jgi:hypothetical protein
LGRALMRLNRTYSTLYARGWSKVGRAPGFNRPQHWRHPKLDGWYMTDKAIKLEGARS